MLRAARGSRSIRELEALTEIPKSRLHRYESGRQQPTLTDLRLIDKELGLQGFLVSYASLEAIRESPASVGRRHNWSYPDALKGPAFAFVEPATDAEAAPLTLTIDWGPWRRDVRFEVPDDGTFLTMVISRSERSAGNVPVFVESSRPVRITFGEGRPPSAGPTVIDVSRGFYLRERSTLAQEAGRLLANALAVCGRTPEELADFLGVDLAAVEAFLDGSTLDAP